MIDELGLDKGGKGVGFNKVEIDSKRLIGGGVCMFVHVGPWCQLDAFYFHLFLEGDCFVNSFLLSHSLRKIRLKTVWRDLQIPPNWREKPLFYLFEKSSKPTTTNQTTQTGYQPYVPETLMAPIEPNLFLYYLSTLIQPI